MTQASKLDIVVRNKHPVNGSIAHQKDRTSQVSGLRDHDKR